VPAGSAHVPSTRKGWGSFGHGDRMGYLAAAARTEHSRKSIKPLESTNHIMCVTACRSLPVTSIVSAGLAIDFWDQNAIIDHEITSSAQAVFLVSRVHADARVMVHPGTRESFTCLFQPGCLLLKSSASERTQVGHSYGLPHPSSISHTSQLALSRIFPALKIKYPHSLASATPNVILSYNYCIYRVRYLSILRTVRYHRQRTAMHSSSGDAHTVG
jgi:hypothetical protein